MKLDRRHAAVNRPYGEGEMVKMEAAEIVSGEGIPAKVARIAAGAAAESNSQAHLAYAAFDCGGGDGVMYRRRPRRPAASMQNARFGLCRNITKLARDNQHHRHAGAISIITSCLVPSASWLAHVRRA